MSVVFVVLTLILAVSTGYLATHPTKQVQTVVSSITQTVKTPYYSVEIGYKPSIGFYLTNSTGFTLYIFKKDVPYNGTSACYGACAKLWPPFYVSNLSLPPGLNSSMFGVITRVNGTKQTTYMGYPLYYYAPDTSPGDTNGEGFLGIWFAATVPSPTTNLTTFTISSFFANKSEISPTTNLTFTLAG